jgi:hypothetical protein
LNQKDTCSRGAVCGVRRASARLAGERAAAEGPVAGRKQKGPGLPSAALLSLSPLCLCQQCRLLC